MTEGADRAKAFATYAAISVGGSAVGLLLGGVLTRLVAVDAANQHPDRNYRRGWPELGS